MAAVRSRGDSASEFWDLAAIFESGHRLFARFSISNEGPGDDTAYVIGQIVFPDGEVVSWTNGRLEGRWEITRSGLRLEIGSSVLDLSSAPRRIEVDKGRKGIKVELDFASQDTAVATWDRAPPGYHLDLIAAGTPVVGTLWARGVVAEPVSVRGTLSATHSFMSEGEDRLLVSRVELHSIAATDPSAVPGSTLSDESTGASLYLVDTLSPTGDRTSWLVLERDGRVVLEMDALTVTQSGHHPASSSRYPMPTSISIDGQGIVGSIELRARLVEHDPLEVAPRLFRWLLSFRMKTRQFWLDATWELREKGAAAESPGRLLGRGRGAVSFYFLNPVPKALR